MEAVDGLGRAQSQFRLAIDSHKAVGEGIDAMRLTEMPSELWLEAMAGYQMGESVEVEEVTCRRRRLSAGRK